MYIYEQPGNGIIPTDHLKWYVYICVYISLDQRNLQFTSSWGLQKRSRSVRHSMLTENPASGYAFSEPPNVETWENNTVPYR